MKKVCKKWNIMIMIFCLVFTMMPVTAFAAEDDNSTSGDEAPTTLTLYYVTQNEGSKSEQIDIKNVSYTDNEDGKDVYNGIAIPLSEIEIASGNDVAYDVTDYVPDIITDTNNEVWELIDAGGGQQILQNIKKGYHEFHYQKVDAENPPEPTVTPGCITITKWIGGDVPDSDATFTFEICNEDGFSTTASIAYDADANNGCTEGENPKIIVNETVTIGNLTPGAYTVAEMLDLDNYDVPEDQTANVASEDTEELTFVNTYHKPLNPPGPTTPGSITITKLIGDDVPVADATFTFEISDDSGFSTTASITYDADALKSFTEEEDSKIIVNQTVTIGNLTPGAYTVSETSDLENYDEPEGQTDDVVSEGNTGFTFTNLYHKPVIPPPDGPEAYVTKTVAEYDGVNIPADSAFTDDLKLDKLGKKVIFKITLSCNAKWVQKEIYTGFEDFFGPKDNTEDITDNLLVLDNGEFVQATKYYWDFPHPIWLSETDKVFYFIDTLEEEGTYTNTANILTYLSEVEDEVEASATATVTVDVPDGGTPDDDDDTDNPPSHHHHSDNNNSGSSATVVPAEDTSVSTVTVPEVTPVNELDNVPKTGDEAPIAPFMVLGTLAAAILSFLGRKYWMGSESK